MEKKKVTMVKTSISHPLRIDEVKTPNGAGIIGMTLCPGKKIVSAMSGVWDRDLDIDLRNLENGNGGSATGALQEKKDSRQYRVRELKDFDAVLSEVIAAGFGPPALLPHLRQYAINKLIRTSFLCRGVYLAVSCMSRIFGPQDIGDGSSERIGTVLRASSFYDLIP